MTRLEIDSPDIQLRDVMSDLVIKFGRLRTFAALLRQLTPKRKLRPEPLPPMNDHLRQDIGLLPLRHRLPSQRMPHW